MSSDTLPSVDALREAVRTARNDEILEVAMFLHDEMVDRCGNAVELAIEADNRDAMNEAFVLVQLVEDLIPAWLGTKNSRSEGKYWRWYHAEERIAKAVTDSREGSRGATRPKAQSAKVAAIKKPEGIALAPFTDEEAIEAVAKTWGARDGDYRKRHGRGSGS